MRRATALLTLATLAFALAGIAGAQTTNTCNDLGFDNLETSQAGEWGSIDFDNTEPTLTLTVEEGWEVRLCVKTGSAQQGDGPEVTDWFGEGEHIVGHSTGKELSHFGFQVREVEDDDTTTTQGDEETTSTTITTTSSSTSGTTVPQDTTTTSPSTSTSTVPQSSTTTTPETTTSQVPPAPTTTHNTPSPEELPFTGVPTLGLTLTGLAALVSGAVLAWKGRGE